MPLTIRCDNHQLCPRPSRLTHYLADGRSARFFRAAARSVVSSGGV